VPCSPAAEAGSMGTIKRMEEIGASKY